MPSIFNVYIGALGTCKNFRLPKGIQSGFSSRKIINGLSEWNWKLVSYNRGVFLLAMPNQTPFHSLVTRYMRNCSQNIQMTNTDTIPDLELCVLVKMLKNCGSRKLLKNEASLLRCIVLEVFTSNCPETGKFTKNMFKMSQTAEQARSSDKKPSKNDHHFKNKCIDKTIKLPRFANGKKWAVFNLICENVLLKMTKNIWMAHNCVNFRNLSQKTLRKVLYSLTAVQLYEAR